MELRQIRYVMAVAQELHFGHAAERLHMTQPSLSRQVRDVENEIGFDLFERTSRGVVMTPAGTEFIGQAGDVLELTAAAVRRTQEVGRGASGHVSLGFVATAALGMLPRALAAHRVQRPGVVVALRELTTEQQLEELLNKNLDVGLGRDVRPIEGLSSEPLRREPIVVAVPEQHPFAERATLTLDDLAGQSIVRMPRERARRIDDLLRRIPATSGAAHEPHAHGVVQEANQYLSLLMLVTADMGLALVPDTVRTLRLGGVRYLPLDEPDASTALMVTTNAEPTNPTTDHLRSVLFAEFGNAACDTAASDSHPA